MSTIDAALLGEAIVLCNGNAVNLPYKKAYALLYYIIIKRKHRLTRAHREKQLKMSCQALHNAPPNRT